LLAEKKTMMKILAATLFAVVTLNALLPSWALAMSTSAEIAKGADLNKQVDRQSLIVDDPFLTNWVSTVGGNLAKYRARQDITYRFEVINSDEINAFALPGGFVHVDMGLLNTVSSDDELAGVMAHEMGHVERRHVVTLDQKNTLLSILIGVLSILSPIAYVLGGYGGDLAMSKFSRQDELQADQYGLLLMSRAGYDPQSMVDFMDQLRKMSETPESKADKAFLDHPVPSDRIAHLEGYPQLDRPTAEQLTAQAIHDQDEGRYSYAEIRFMQALKLSTSDVIAQQHLTAVQLALKNSGVHAPSDTQYDPAFALDPQGRNQTAALVQTSEHIARDDAAIAKEQSKLGQRESESLFTQLQSLTGAVPNLPPAKTPTSNLAIASNGLDRLVQDVNGTLGLTSDVMSAAPGLLADNQQLLRELGDPLRDGTPTPTAQSVLQYYPAVAAQLAMSSDELVRAVDRSRAAINASSDSIHVLKDYFLVLDSTDIATKGDISDKDMPKVQAALDTALTEWDRIKAAALQADNEVYIAQSRWLSARISLLDLTSSPERYRGFQHAMAYRFPGVVTPDYAAVMRSGMPPGEVACTAWLSYETKQPVDQLISQLQAAGQTCESASLARGLLTESLEVASGLLYQDYIDKPHSIAVK
jgi:beta-barrel assembly-enhancing protease